MLYGEAATLILFLCRLLGWLPNRQLPISFRAEEARYNQDVLRNTGIRERTVQRWDFSPLRTNARLEQSRSLVWPFWKPALRLSCAQGQGGKAL